MKKSKVILSSAVAAALMVSACSRTATPESIQSQSSEMVVQTEASTDTSVLGAERELTETTAAQTDASAFFASHAGTYECTGVKGSITINADGTFDYIAIDGAAGTRHICAATGKFGEVIQDGDSVYKIEITDMTYSRTAGETWDEDDLEGGQIHCEAFESGDIMAHDVITFYDAGINTADLPEAYVNAYTITNSMNPSELPEKFPAAGLYNGMSGVSYVASNSDESSEDASSDASETEASEQEAQ